VPTYISLLRAVSLAGHNRIKMRALEAAFEGLGCEQVRTYRQSGNVVFHLAKPSANLCETIEERIHRHCGLSISVISRTEEELGNTIQKNPFLTESGVDPSKPHVTFLASAPTAAEEKLDRLRAGPDRYRYRGREVYLYCPQAMAGRNCRTWRLRTRSLSAPPPGIGERSTSSTRWPLNSSDRRLRWFPPLGRTRARIKFHAAEGSQN
jgi:uncharacterized protein (DUF1697 family)